MDFYSEHKRFDWAEITKSIYAKSENDVIDALDSKNRSLDEFLALVSPSAEPYLENMAAISNKLTQKRFGKTVRMYAPLYLSNKCSNKCVYCGFNFDNTFERKTLNFDEVLKEAEVLKDYGYDHVLLVSGEYPSEVDTNYLCRVIETVRPYFSQISIEVQPLDQVGYESLISCGLNGVYIYQETYNSKNYHKFHPGGKKSDFFYRLETPDRMGRANIHKIGIGCLLGLEDWRTDSFFTAMHLKYLEKNYWKSRFSISFPRLRPHAGQFQPAFPVNDKELVQLITAYRLIDEDVELSISVRESEKFRDNIIKLGITSMSAGSRTEPGGYSKPGDALEQFATHDNRSPEEIKQMIIKNGYEPVWKDWDSKCFS